MRDGETGELLVGVGWACESGGGKRVGSAATEDYLLYQLDTKRCARESEFGSKYDVHHSTE